VGRIYCDMDMVLVHQTSGERFDIMPWMPGGKELWQFLSGRNVILLSQVKQKRFGLTAAEKLAWIDRELGPDVPVIFTPDSRGKGPFARAGDVLIDDAEKHCNDWAVNGGIAIRHLNVEATIFSLRPYL